MNNTPFTNEQRDEVRQRIIATARDAGGMLTASQLREALSDVPAGERAQAIAALQMGGQLDSVGTGSTAIHSLTRPAATQDAAPQSAPSVVQGGAVTISEPVAGHFPPAVIGKPEHGRDDPLALRKRIETINQDIHEALVDACCIELPHLTIQHLLDADRATRAAAETVAR